VNGGRPNGGWVTVGVEEAEGTALALGAPALLDEGPGAAEEDPRGGGLTTP
jgi:hypothetical protein